MKEKVSFKQIIKLAVPAIIAGIAEPILSITDAAIVGNMEFNATEALSAIGIAGSFITAIIWILAQTRAAISAIIGQYLGADKLKEINSLPAQIIAINVFLSLVIYGISIMSISYVFELYNAKGLLLNYATSYYKIRAIGLPFTLFIFSVYGVFRGLQNTFYPMVISIIGVIINIILDYILVFGIKEVIQPMYVEGAAIASVVSQIIMAIIALYLFIKKSPFSLKLKLPLNKEIKRLLHLSLNLFIRTLSLNIALNFANAYATKYGSHYIAAHTIAFQIWLFFAFFMDGFSSVGNIVSAKLLGERNYKKMFVLIKDLTKFTIIIAFLLGLVCFLFYKPLGSIFTKDEEVLTLFYSVFWIVILMQPINAIAFIYDGVFKGLTEAVKLRNVLLTATFFGFLPALFISDYYNLKLYAIWIAFTVWMLFRAISLFYIFKKKYVVSNY